jgi:Tetracyclin repressor-like, C-terminal domain
VRTHSRQLRSGGAAFHQRVNSPFAGLKGADAVRGYLFVIGVGMTIMAPTGRLNRLSGDRCDDADIDAMVDHAVPFAAADLRSFVTHAAENGITCCSPSQPSHHTTVLA